MQPAVSHLHGLAHLKPRTSLDLSLVGQGHLLCAPPRPDSERALRPSQRRCPSERALLPRDLGFPALSILYHRAVTSEGEAYSVTGGIFPKEGFEEHYQKVSS
jgi:hypothetical protein